MALSPRLQMLLTQLSKHGDILAKAALGKTTAHDDVVLGSFSKRGDLLSQVEVKGAGAITSRAKGLTGSWAKRGDALAGGLTRAIGLTVAADKLSPLLYGSTVTFTATGSGKAGSESYKYRYTLDNTVVKVWNATATYTTSATLAVGTHVLKVDVSAEGTVAGPQNSTTITLVIAANTASIGEAVTAGVNGTSAKV